MKKIIILALLLSSGFAVGATCKSDGQAETECCELLKSKNQTTFSRLATLDKSVCTMSVYAGDSNSSFRRFGFASDGQISIFMQPGGNRQKGNSSQSFLIFPSGEIPMGRYEGDEKLQVRSGSGQKWTFNTQTALPSALEGCSLTVSPKFSLQDSGVRIQNCKKHLVIETPVEVGGEYIAYPDKPLTMRDPAQNTCRLKNSDIYSYKKDGTNYKDKLGRHFTLKLKYKSNAEMAQKFKILCPRLDVSMLLVEPAKAPRKIDPTDEKRARDILDGRTGN